MGQIFTEKDDFVAVIESLAEAIDFHHGHNSEIELEGADSARGLWSLHYSNFATREATARQIAGHYRDRYVRQDGKWLIERSHFSTVSHGFWQTGADGVVAVREIGRTLVAAV